MSIKSAEEVKKSRIIGSVRTCLIITFSIIVAVAGKAFLGDIEDPSLVFILMVRRIFPGVISGVMLSAILAAAMSTADSQLLASVSAFTSDVYKPVFRKNASDKEMLWAGRGVVIAISVVSIMIASNPDSGSIMDLVENAWGLFGASFGPAVMLSLFWKKFTFRGAVASIVSGAAVDALWLGFCSGTGIYEIIPGFLAGVVMGAAVSLAEGGAEKEVQELFNKAVRYDK